MTTIYSTATSLQRQDADGALDEAQLAAAAFLARYSGRTLDAYRHDPRGFFQWSADAGLTANNPPGMNADGTWGTSAGGAVGNFAPTTVTERVWRRLRKWWLAKAGAWVAPGLTTDWSLKRDQDTTNNPARSPRINYHINVA
jgi:hypothetical protein